MSIISKLFFLVLFFCFSFPLYALQEGEKAGHQSNEPIATKYIKHKKQEDSKQHFPKESRVLRDRAIEQKAEAIYNQYCFTCHQSGLAGAPRFRNKEDWGRDVLAQKKYR